MLLIRNLWTGRNIELRDELVTLRDTTAQSYAHAEDLKQRWVEIEKAQANLYQVSHLYKTELLLLLLNVVLINLTPQRHRPSFLHLRLRHSLTAQDELSEKMASAFIEGRGGNNGGSGAVSSVDSPVPGTATPIAGGSDRVSPF